MERSEAIEIPFGAFDSELKGWEYTIPEGMKARIEGNKIILEPKESEDERIRKEMLEYCYKRMNNEFSSITIHQVKRWLAWLENQGSQNLVDKVEPKFKAGDKVISTISNIPYYITEVCNGYYLTDVGCIIMFNAQDNFELVEQNPAWSEDTQQWIDAIIKDYEKQYDVDKDHRATIQIQIDILKSLKERCAWKPSDEQMADLEYIMTYYPNIRGMVNSIYNDLKNLKG